MEELKNSEEIRIALQNHIDSSPARKGDNTRFKWDEELLDLRNLYLWALIREGYSRVRCNQVVSEVFNISKVSADKYYKSALEALTVENDGIRGAARKVAIERLNGIVEEEKRRGNNYRALQALDQLNKINGLYSEKREVEITGMKFDFGGE